MTTTYYKEITLDEFKTFLKEEKGWTVSIPEGSKEYAFDWDVKNTPVFIRVWSSIHIDTDTARKKGGDAIRVTLCDSKNQKGIKKFTRIHRMENYQDKLQTRILQAVNHARTGIKVCSKCGSVMAIREPKKNQTWNAFFGCSNFPNCRETAKV